MDVCFYDMLVMDVIDMVMVGFVEMYCEFEVFVLYLVWIDGWLNGKDIIEWCYLEMVFGYEGEVEVFGMVICCVY